jgi:hypothetical protein
MVAHGGTSVADSFIQTLTMVDVATGWTECLPLVTHDGSLVVEAMKHARSLFPWLLLGVDFDNDSAFMNDVVVPWARVMARLYAAARLYVNFFQPRNAVGSAVRTGAISRYRLRAQKKPQRTGL